MKKIVSTVLSLNMALGMCASVNAADNKLADAQAYIMGTAINSSISDADSSDVYKIELNGPSTISLDLTAQIFRLNFKLYDRNGKELWSDKQTSNDTTKEISYKKDITLCKGTYYLEVSKSSGVGDYSLNITEKGIYETVSEDQGGSNNATKAASPVGVGIKYGGCIAVNDDVDIYYFDVDSSGKISVNLTSNISKLKLRLCDDKNKEAWNDVSSWNAETKEMNYSKEMYINKARYYFYVNKSEGEGSYSFQIDFTPSEESFIEAYSGINNDMDSASIIEANKKYKGLIAANDDADVYEIELDEGEITVDMTSEMDRLQLRITNQQGKEVWRDKAEKGHFSKSLKIEHGKYYFHVVKGEGQGSYNFFITDGGVVTDAKAAEDVITVKVNNKNVSFDQPPVLENGRTLVPLRAIFEALGAKVDWDQNTQTVTASKGDINISLQIGSANMNVNGENKVLDVPAKIAGGRTLVPVRAISEAFGCDVNWDGATKTVIINSGK